MPTLATDLRNLLERAVVDARVAAEAGARAALEALAVHNHEPYTHMKPAQRVLRNHLRARARQLGDHQDSAGRLAIHHLVGECAYEHWHRMLFARFLAENSLLIEPDAQMAVSLSEAEELAKDDGLDVWEFASRCAQRMLPQIFRPDDPLLQVSYATEHRLSLEKTLSSLPSAVFTASDALGWVYQFWQGNRKDEVNRSEVKIGADEIPAVTQLFTEPYMVDFIIHNTLGAWWAGRRLSPEDAASARTESELRLTLSLPGLGWEYLRFVRGADGRTGSWRPAAGTFDSWPKSAAGLRILDPCCGSGHFLVAALHHLVPIRMAEESLSAGDAVAAVLRDNLHGLEIDERCCQIAAFALAFAAWTYPDAGGFRPLPELHVACTGLGPHCSAQQWTRLAEQSGLPMPTIGREPIKNGLLNLHHLFSQAPTIGSLIQPATLPADLIAADYATIRPYLAAISAAEKDDDETHERAIAAAGMVKAVDLLGGKYTLVVTNVPYLGRGRQVELLKTHLENHYREGKADLASAFVMRCLELCGSGGTAAMVTPQYWLFLTSYKRLRATLLRHQRWDILARLGPGAFEGIGGHVVNVALLVVSHTRPTEQHLMVGVDALEAKEPWQKAAILRGESGDLALLPQAGQLTNPDAVVTLTRVTGHALLEEYGPGLQGIASSDNARYRRYFTEVPAIANGWERLQTTPDGRTMYRGRDEIIHWEGGKGEMARCSQSRIQGMKGWGVDGVAVNRVSRLYVTPYTGEIFDDATSVMPVSPPIALPAVWAYCEDPSYELAVRRLNQKVSVANATLVKVPFDIDHWTKVAARKYPDGLPEPESDDPTQWLFHGRPDEAQEGAELHVAVSRLLGYRWPAELDDKMRLSRRARTLVRKCEELTKFADSDGIICIPAVRGVEPASERLQKILAACEVEQEGNLDEWLRNAFFEEHCKLFHDRPFVWHIWDGRKRDGFHALVNYHRLSEGGGKGRRLLESLTYAYLGEWITRQKDGVKRGEDGAEARLAASVELQMRLEAILAGEPPFDIFVRWKPLHQQPIGWEPDINDGVRVNIRPFLADDLPGGRTGAGVLRWKPNIKWTKDRGKEPQRPKAEYPWFWGWDERTEDFSGGKAFDGNRWNDCHYSTRAKVEARTKFGTKPRKS